MTANTISVEADLYVLLSLSSEALWHRLNSQHNDEFRAMFAFREQDIVQWEQQSLPLEMSDWRYMHLNINADEVANRAASRTISAKGLKHIPDTLGWNPLRLVSTRLRDFLLITFPDGSLFFPFFSIDETTGNPEPTEFWYWLPVHYLSFRPNPKRNREQSMRPQVWGSHGGHDATWEMYHNTAFQDFVADLPFWTPSPTFGEVVFRPDIYQLIQAAGFSGFLEAPADNYLRHTPEHCVGYIQYNK